MKSRFTILSTGGAFLLMLGLAVSPGFAQDFDVTKTVPTVTDTGHNQQMGKLTLAAGATPGDQDLLGYDDGDTMVTISYGGLKIANANDANLVSCEGSYATITDGGPCDTQVNHDAGTDGSEDTPEVNSVRATLSADKTKIVLLVFAATGDAATDKIIIDGVRVDTSSKDDGDEIMVDITVSQGTPDGSVNVGGDSRTVETVIANVKAGLAVPSVSAAAAVTCAPGGEAIITVKEGFATAWENVGEGGGRYTGESTQIKISVQNLPADVQFMWPKEVGSVEVKVDEDIKRKAGASMLLLQSSEKATEAIYAYDEVTDSSIAESKVAEDYDHADVADSFVIKAKVVVGAGAVATAKPADVWAWLYPEVGSISGRETSLSFAKDPVTDKNDDNPNLVEGEFLTLGDCVTYLLFPYVTCGSTEDWTTGLAISNTSMDDALFDHLELKKDSTNRGGAVAQSGPIYVHAYPMSAKAADGSSGTLPASSSTMVTPKLASGDTIAFACEGVISGDGYLIAEAHFRYAYGMAFAFGNFTGGATRDVAHGYTALVISGNEDIR